MTTAVGVVRQSRKSEAAASPEAQRRAIEQFAESQGWQLVDVFADLGRSGYDPRVQRPGLEAALGLVERGGVDRVIVWKLDRLTRRGIGEALAIVDRIKACDASLVSVTEPFDTSSALGEGIFALLLSLAKAESEKLGERVKSGKTVVRTRGGWLGGPVPFGFQVERVSRGDHVASRLVLDPDRAPVVRSMVDDVLAGKSVRALVGRLNAEGVKPPRGREWAHASLLGLLRNPVLAGYLPDGRGDVLRDAAGQPVVPGKALLDEAEWRELQRRLAPRAGRRPEVPSLLGGIAVCAGCGGTMGGESGGRSPNYRCNRSSGGRACPAPARVPMRATDEHVVAVLARELRAAIDDHDRRADGDRGKLLDRVARWWMLRNGTADVSALVTERDEIADARARLREMYVAGDFADDPRQYRLLFDRYQQRWDELSARIGAFEKLPTPDVVAAPDFVESLDFETKRDLLALVLRIECVKAGRPGIKFVPDERLNLSLILDWDLLVRVAGRAEPDADVERRHRAVELVEGMVEADPSLVDRNDELVDELAAR